MIRKILACLGLKRITPAVENFLPAYQHAYRAERSTTEVIWTIQTLMANVNRFHERYITSACDLSKAFDKCTRKLMIDIFERYNLATEDELRILQYLLSETELIVRINGNIGKSFKTKTGTPQGDSLSPVLFIVYLEHLMREHQTRAPSRDKAEDYTILFADDIKLLHHSRVERGERHTRPRESCQCINCEVKRTNKELVISLEAGQMEVNKKKSVKGLLNKGKVIQKAKFVGGYTDTDKEISERVAASEKAFLGMIAIFKRNSGVTKQTKIRLYNAMVKPILMYNLWAVPFRKDHRERIDRTHRRQLRYLMGYYYKEDEPMVIYQQIYINTNSRPISVDLLRLRRTLLGHILRRSVHNIPA